MKLTTMKISVPVLMLMMFQSGYGVSDWFAKAWSAMNQGKTAEAFAVVHEAKPEKAPMSALSNEEKEKFTESWVKDIRDAVANVAPLYFADEDGEFTDFQNAMLSEDATHGALLELFDADEEINANTVNGALIEYIRENVDNKVTDTWLLPNENYVKKNDGKGINWWVDQLITHWGKDDFTDNPENLLKSNGGQDGNDDTLRGSLTLTVDEINGMAVDIGTKAVAAQGEDKTTEEAALTTALRDALENVLVNRIKNPTGDDDDEKLLYKNNQLRYFIQTYRDRNVTDDDKTVIDYGDDDTTDNSLSVILEEAGATPTVDSIKTAVDKVISADLSLLLRHTGSVNVDTLDNAIASSSGDDYEDQVATGLKSVTQTFGSAVDGIISKLKTIKEAIGPVA